MCTLFRICLPRRFNANKPSVQRASDSPAGESFESAEGRTRGPGAFGAMSVGPTASVLQQAPPSPSSPRAAAQHQQTSRFARKSLPASRPTAAAQAAAVPAPPPLPPADESQRLLALQICLKVADIGHLAGTLPVHKR